MNRVPFANKSLLYFNVCNTCFLNQSKVKSCNVKLSFAGLLHLIVHRKRHTLQSSLLIQPASRQSDVIFFFSFFFFLKGM